MKEKAYIEFIRYSLDEKATLPESIVEIDWGDFINFCYQQSVFGIALAGIEKAKACSTSLSIDQMDLLEWIGMVESVKAQNEIINKRGVAVTKWFEERGYRSVILKGQANGLMYPRPEYRIPGDIDIWVEGKDGDIIKLVLKEWPDAHYSIHHVKMPVFNDVSVEVHYKPMYLMNWFADRKLQNYIGRIEDAQFSNKVNLGNGKIGVLTDDFNLVYQLLHMYAHLFSTRNNFKQLVDYYYLLRKAKGNFKKTEIKVLLEQFEILKYAKGIMWIMSEVLGVEANYLIVDSDKNIGRLLLKETMKYGMYENRTAVDLTKQFFGNLKLAGVFPKNVLISPLFLLWHQWWKYKTNLALKRL